MDPGDKSEATTRLRERLAVAIATMEGMAAELRDVKAAPRLAVLETKQADHQKALDDLRKLTDDLRLAVVEHEREISALRLASAEQDKALNSVCDDVAKLPKPQALVPAPTGEHALVQPPSESVVVLGWFWKNRSTILTAVTFVMASLGLGAHFKGCVPLPAEVAK